MDNKPLLEVYEKLLILHNGGTNVIENPNYREYIQQIKANLSSASDHSLIVKIMQGLLDNDVCSIREDVISMLRDSNVDLQFKKDLLESECFEGFLRQAVKSGDLEGLVELCEALERVDVVHVMQLFTDTLETICKSDELSQQCKKFICNILVPKILIEQTHNNVKLNLALCFASVMPVTTLTEEEYKHFSVKIDEYIKTISDLRENNYENWHLLWMFLVRLLGKKLHQSMNLMNKLLRVVEAAFRNQCHEQRLKGYDCWKELIDNEYLDPQHLTSDKQIKLILTPLRAKFSRQEAVVLKRFEVFAYLMNRLQNKAVLVLKEFLEFTFGAVGENTDPHKSGLAKTVADLRLRSAAVFIAVLGHSHEDAPCIETSDVTFHSPPLTKNVIFGLYHHVINSAGEVSRLLKDNAQFGPVHCVWKSLLNLILPNDHEHKDNAAKLICNVFVSFLQDTDVYFQNVAMVIFMEAAEVGVGKCLEMLLEHFDEVLKVLFTVALDVERSSQITTLIPLLQPSHTTQIIAAFSKYKTLERNVDYIDDLWLFSAKTCQNEDLSEKLNFWLWPVLYGNFLKPVKLDDLFETLIPLVNSNNDLHTQLLKELGKLLKNSPLLANLIVKLLCSLELKQDFTATLTLDVVAEALGVSDEAATSASQFICKLLQLKLQEPDIVHKTSLCLQQLLKLNNYDFVDHFDCGKDLTTLYAKHLTSDFLNNLEQNSKVQKLAKLMQQPKKPLTDLMSMGGRSAKIANLVKKIPQSPQKTLRLFGKDIETHSPIKCIGSQLKKNSPKVTPSKVRKPEPPMIDDESNSKFVLINSEVKVNTNNLTEHQKETFNKRDEDIPALYQDLSQSQTSNSFKKPMEVDEGKKKEEAKKVKNELKKLTMNIVGADEFLLSSNKRKRREKKVEDVEMEKKKAETGKKKDCDVAGDKQNEVDAEETVKKKQEAVKKSPETDKKVKKLTDNVETGDIKRNETVLKSPNSDKKAKKPETNGKASEPAKKRSYVRKKTPESKPKSGENSLTETPKHRKHSSEKIILKIEKTKSTLKSELKVKKSRKSLSMEQDNHEKKERKNRKSLPNMKLETQSEIFHVTADAVVQENDQVFQDHISEAIEHVVQKAYKHSGKKRKLSDDEDEDIVTSSQETTNTSKLRLSITKKNLESSPKRRGRSKTPPLPETETQTQSEGLELSSEGLQFELPQSKLLTDSEKELARMDTASLPMVELSFNSEKEDTVVENRTLVSKEEAEKENVENEAYDDGDEVLEINGEVEDVTKTDDEVQETELHAETESSLPASPINENTPNKTNELLNNTMDISPIGSKSSSEEDTREEIIEERRLVPVALKFDNEVEHDAVKQKSPEKGDDAPEKSPEKEMEIAMAESTGESDVKPAAPVSVDKQEKNNWLKQESPATHQRFLLRKNKGLNMSPSASRIKKLMSNVKPPSQTETADELTKDNILTFSREVPSPLATPKSSILKRKHSDTPDDVQSPLAKRKRVNFSDPCTTSQKVFLKDDGGFPMTSEDEEELEKQFLEVLSEGSDVDSERIELVVNHTSEPIYSALMDCDDDVSVISRKLTSPMFVNAFISKLNSCNIKTIGDLAKMSRVDIRRLPFKSPLDDSVFKALDTYYQNKCKINGDIKGEHNYSDPTSDLATLDKFPVDDIVQHLFDKCDRQEVVDSFLARFNKSDISRLFDKMSADKLRQCGTAFLAQVLD